MINGAIITAQISRNPKYLRERLKSKQLYILQGLPKVGSVLSRRLIEHFKSVSNVMKASANDLSQVNGIGKLSAEKIRSVLDAEFFKL